MASGQELQVQQKRELEKKEEGTVPARIFVPATDIWAPRKIGATAPTPQNCRQMIPFRSRSDS
jgi:hypothetical protein